MKLAGFLLMAAVFNLGVVTGCVFSKPRKEPPLKPRFQVTYPEIRSIYSVQKLHKP